MTIEDEAQAAAEQRYPLFNDRLDYPSAAVTHYMRGAFQSGAKWAASRPTGETFDEDTLRKVYGALEDVMGLDHQFVVDAINAMQNAGILFRERSAEPAPADEREALAQVVSQFGYKGYPSNGDYEEADAILAAGFHRHPRPTEGGLEEASRLLYEDEREWYGNPKWPAWEDADEVTRREMRRAMRAALRAAARVADQEGENR